MAKLKAPLFSLGASGSLAKTLVYFGWKGLNAVREHVVPTNPNTSAQQTQRGYMASALTEFHGASYSEDDITAFARLAGAEGLIMTGFNRMVKEFIDESVAGGTWERISRVTTDTVQAAQFGVGCYKAPAGNAPTLRWGSRKTYLPNSIAMTDGGDGTWHAYATGLAASTLYYFTMDVGAAGADWGKVGTYMQRTIA